jgi:glycerophosphoryl diester phosphodiesterase
MTSRILGLLALLAATLVSPSLVSPSPAGAAAPPAPAAQLRTQDPIVIAHRGASGYRPEHTLAAYRLAIQLGADYIEPDLVSTKDGVLVARHENEISGTTDVADHPEFAERRTTKTIDGVQVTGWFTEDFTLSELRTLRAKERLPQVRPRNTRYDGRFEIPTLTEVLQLVKTESRRAGRAIGVAPETKHPTYFDSIGLSLEEPLVRALKQFHLDGKRAKAVLQSFEVDNLKDLNRMVRTPIAQLVDASQAARVTQEGLRQISEYAEWVAPTKDLVLPRDPATGATGAPSSVVEWAHAQGLKVVVWTLRDENQFMATNFRIGTDPNASGNIYAEVTAFLDAGVDAVFADYPDSAVDARDDWLREALASAG